MSRPWFGRSPSADCGVSSERVISLLRVRAREKTPGFATQRSGLSNRRPAARQHADFEVIVPEELLAQAQKTQQLFNIIIGAIAGISLIVGGIGIMNIMLANVSERTREIGIRRAIGATKRDILIQFLIEAVLVCLLGGTIGVLLGFGLAQLIAEFAEWATAFSPLSVPIALGTSVVIGVVFGIIPARRAAQLHPVQALRFE